MSADLQTLYNWFTDKALISLEGNQFPIGCNLKGETS